MARFRDRDKRHFPLTDISSILGLFRDQLGGPEEPNLALLSIVVGCVENTLTLNRAVTSYEDSLLQPIFPVVDFETVEALYTKFEALVKGAVDLSKYPSGYSTRELVKKVSDVIWGSLSRSFKDKAHLQSLYSFLTGNKLDCFGVALGVVAAAQILGLSDIHLALSEDHAWVVFGEDNTDTAEVTWHGKGNEDKRGQSITLSVAEKSWLYLNGHPIICDRKMEVAAIVSAANPGINVSMDSIEMGSLQQELLWLLYDKGLLLKYPMALGNLGDLEEISPTPGRPPSLAIFQESISSSVKHYNNYHVYPYTYMGGYLYRKRMYKEAIKCWAEASNVIRKFNYTREDEEIYKEFLEIANELVPNIVKALSLNITDRVQITILNDPEVYADILRFYDGICEWEEGSSTPVLHVGWAQNLTFSLNKFDPLTRAKIDVGKDEENDDDDDEENDDDAEHKFKGEKDSKPGSERQAVKSNDVRDPLNGVVDNLNKGESSLSSYQSNLPGHLGETRGRRCQRRRNSSATKDLRADDSSGKLDARIHGNDHSEAEHKIKSTIEELASKIGHQECGLDTAPNPNITALAQQCSLNILNKDYLLGAGEPFSSSNSEETFPSTLTPISHITGSDSLLVGNECLSTNSNGTPVSSLATNSNGTPLPELTTNSNGTPLSGQTTNSNGTPLPELTTNSTLNPNSPSDVMVPEKKSDSAAQLQSFTSPSFSPTADILASVGSVQVELRSEKMKGLKKMFTSSKLNASAIKLQLTAQSQVHVKHSRFLDFGEPVGSARKRQRREIV